MSGSLLDDIGDDFDVDEDEEDEEEDEEVQIQSQPTPQQQVKPVNVQPRVVVPVKPANQASTADDAEYEEHEEIEEYEEEEEDGDVIMHGDWEECYDDARQRTYYYNVKTGVSAWVLPPGVK